MAAPNLIQVTQVYGRTVSATVGTAVTILASNPSASNKAYKLNAFYLANIDNLATVKISVDFFRFGASFRLVDRMDIAPGETLVVMSRDTSIYLEESDSLRCYADQDGAIHAVLSYEINS
jgi:hypothetical protein